MERAPLAIVGLGAIALGLAVLLPADDRAAGTPAPTPPMAVAAVTTSPRGAAPSAPASTVPPIPAGHRIRLPRLGIDLEIREGDIERDAARQETPEGFALHLPGTALPGTGGNVYLYAHARRGMFLALWDARVGDEVWIALPDGGALRYVVRELHRASPDDLSWTAPTATERLTLQTSTGPLPGDPRFIVVATPD